jgi:hypothetical protein
LSFGTLFNSAGPVGVTKNIAVSSTLVVGGAYWNPGPATNLTDIIVAAFLDSGTTQVDLRMTSSGYFYFTRNGTSITGVKGGVKPDQRGGVKVGQ